MTKAKSPLLKIGTILLISLAPLVWISKVAADPLPEGKRQTIEGALYQCYDLEGYKALLQMALEYNYFKKEFELVSDETSKLKDATELLKEQVETKQKELILLSKDRDRMYQLWSDENKKRHIAEERPRLGSFLAWSLAGSLALSTAILAGVIVFE